MSNRPSDPSMELLKEVRALNASEGQLTPVDITNVNAVAQHLKDSFQYIESMANNPYVNPSEPYYSSALHFFRAKCLREKRCLVSYLKWRMDRVSGAWWETQDNLIAPHLSAAEMQYLRDYNTLMVDYMSSFAVPLDLRAFRWRPPTSRHASVRGLRESTFISSTTGITYRIQTGEYYSMPCEEAERLIQQGIVAPQAPA